MEVQPSGRMTAVGLTLLGGPWVPWAGSLAHNVPAVSSRTFKTNSFQSSLTGETQSAAEGGRADHGAEGRVLPAPSTASAQVLSQRQTSLHHWRGQERGLFCIWLTSTRFTFQKPLSLHLLNALSNSVPTGCYSWLQRRRFRLFLPGSWIRGYSLQ